MGLWNWLFGSPGKPSTSRTDAAHRSEASAMVRWREGSFPMDAVGESNYQIELRNICGGYNWHGQQFEVDAKIVREPQNPFDANATAVEIAGQTVGYLPREQAKRLASQMASDGIYSARCKAKIVGGWRTNQHDVGYFGVRLAIPRHGWIDFGLGKTAPRASQAAPKNKKKSNRPIAAATGPLAGERVVVWGAQRYGDVAKELASLGAHIMAGVGKTTTLVVQVDDELTLGMRTSSTYRKAMLRIEEGAQLEIVTLRELRGRLAQQP